MKNFNAEQAHEDMILEDTKTIVVEKEQLYSTKSGDIKVLPAAAGYRIPKTKRMVVMLKKDIITPVQNHKTTGSKRCVKIENLDSNVGWKQYKSNCAIRTV